MSRRVQADAARDSFDARDLIYRPGLVRLEQELYPEWDKIQLIDQEKQGACAGFGLAALINYLNAQRGDKTKVSARMLYRMAQQYDEWPGDQYEGSSARGAMKGWYKNGVCSEAFWPNDPAQSLDDYLTRERQEDALRFPLGAYYRVLPRRVDVHAALNEVGVVYVTAATHTGWDDTSDGHISFKPGEDGGGHAFAIVGYTEKGFIIQNSWDPELFGGFKVGRKKHKGFALWSYDDFDANVWDIWVARMAMAVNSLDALRSAYGHGVAGSRATSKGPPRHEIQDHYVHLDDGRFDEKSDYPSAEAQVKASIGHIVDAASGRNPKPIMLYAHGGLNKVGPSVARASAWNPVMKANGVSQIHFVWETGPMAELKDVIKDKLGLARERAGASVGWKDRFLEKFTKGIGHALWKEMREGAAEAFESWDPTKHNTGAGTRTLEFLADAIAAKPENQRPSVHVACHSAGAVFAGHLLDRWASLNAGPIENLLMFAPACTVEFFVTSIAQHLKSRLVGKATHFQLSDGYERGDTVGPYDMSLLYLVSRAYQDKRSIVPILGMQKYAKAAESEIKKLKVPQTRYVTHATGEPKSKTTSTSHGGFDNDLATMNELLEVIIGRKPRTKFRLEHLSGY